MYRRSANRAGSTRGFRGAISAALAGLALLMLAPVAARAADMDGFDTKTLAHQTRHLLNDAGQVYLVWWLPPAMCAALLRDAPNVQPADRERMLRALEPYLVFAVSRGQEGATHLEDVHDRNDLLQHSRLSVDGQPISAVPDPGDPAVQAALAALRPVMAPMLGRDGYGIEFALYQMAPGVHAPDPTMGGRIEYTLYRKRFDWNLPVWASMTTGSAAAIAAPTALPPAPPAAPVFVPVPPPPAPPPPVPPPPVHAASAAVPGAPAAAAPSAAPTPVQHRKVDPTTGEEFPERYDYNPYTGQRLVSQ